MKRFDRVVKQFRFCANMRNRSLNWHVLKFCVSKFERLWLLSCTLYLRNFYGIVFRLNCLRSFLIAKLETFCNWSSVPWSSAGNLSWSFISNLLFPVSCFNLPIKLVFITFRTIVLNYLFYRFVRLLVFLVHIFFNFLKIISIILIVFLFCFECFSKIRQTLSQQIKFLDWCFHQQLL